MQTLSIEEVQMISGGVSAYFNLGRSIGEAYWHSRDYMTDVFYPYWFG